MDQPTGADEDDGRERSGEGQRELDATLGVPEAAWQLDLEDDDRGVPEQRRGGDGRQEARWPARAAAKLHPADSIAQ